jgi:thiol-disulfide isomerase/thioredoxin
MTKKIYLNIASEVFAHPLPHGRGSVAEPCALASGLPRTFTTFCLVLALAAAPLFAQDPLSQAEQQSLQKALGEAGNSPVDFVRALENHLKQYPNTSRRAELERALMKTAMDLKDDARMLLYGEGVLAGDPGNVQVLQSLTTALLHKGDKASAEKALEHARRLEQIIQATYNNDKFVPGAGRTEVKRKDDHDRSLASARLLQARAHGLMGETEQAIQVAESSYDVFPSVEAAREAARWLSSAGKDREAIQYLANAFAIASFRSADPDGANDRARISELYRKLNGSEAGLGDLILKAYDNTSASLAARRAEQHEFDPNSQLKDPMQFTLSGLEGDKLKLSSLMGKVIVMDFWATWCIPCRAQHPLYEAVKEKYKDTDEVVFLAVDTDEEKGVVKPFMQAQNWSQKVYFEDGLASLLQVSNIPTTLIFGKKGDVTSRMIGYIPDRFVDMLSERIDDALGKPPRPQSPAKAPLPEPISAPIRQ